MDSRKNSTDTNSSTTTLLRLFKFAEQAGEECTLDANSDACKAVQYQIKKHGEDETPPLSLADKLHILYLQKKSFDNGQCKAVNKFLRNDCNLKDGGLLKATGLDVSCDKLDREVKEEIDLFINKFNRKGL
jgi:hypothetical protein